MEPIKVLLIEDNPGDSHLIETHLSSVRNASFNITAANRLSQGFKCLEMDHFDVVLLDLNLPDSIGKESFEQLLQHFNSTNNATAPIILLTGLDDEDLALETVRNGAQDYLLKSELDGNLLSRSIRYAIERQRAEEALRESKERYELATQGANDGLWDWQLRSNRMYFSPRWKAMLGYQDDEIGSDPAEWLNRIHKDEVEWVRAEMAAHLEKASPHFESEYRIQHKDGRYIWVLTRGLAVRDSDGQAYRMAGSQSDITLRKQAEEQLLKNAFYDELTGLPNRALFMDRLNHAITHAKRHPKERFSVLFMDLDRFKVINDSLGHMAGDKFLIAAAQVLKKCMRQEDTVARWGGDEFVILLEVNKLDEDAEAVSKRIHEELKKPLTISANRAVLSTSIGIVYSTLEYDTPEEILRDADIAMYSAKKKGGAAYSIFNPAMRKQALSRLEVENDMRRALENHEFAIHYQPILSLYDEHIIGFEALLRWNHPTRGLILPDESIPVAEETGLILPIGHWVMQEACYQIKKWQIKFPLIPPLSVSVNVSGKQLSNPDFLNNIEAILKETGIEPFTLAIEITESLLPERNAAFTAQLEGLVQLGIHLHIDDFGKGYSTYGYLQDLPLKSIKIDSGFIHRLGAGGDNIEIVRSIIMLARSLNMSAIAEGVESEAEYAKLKELHCPYGQGYFFSKPLTSEDAEVLLASRYLEKFYAGACVKFIE